MRSEQLYSLLLLSTAPCKREETAEVEAMERRVDADLRYQRDWSLMLDIKILIKTLLHLRSPNAY